MVGDGNLHAFGLSGGLAAPACPRLAVGNNHSAPRQAIDRTHQQSGAH